MLERLMLRSVSYIVFLLFLASSSLVAQDRDRQQQQVTGKVIDAETRNPIPGALIHIRTPAQRIYTDNNGTFRLAPSETGYQMRISSLGYKRLDTTVTGTSPNLVFALTPSSIKFPDIEVTGKLDGNLIVQRAIRRKEENATRLQTVQGLLYSKISADLEGSTLGELERSGNAIIMETFANTYYRGKDWRVDIVQRRQTANVEPESNALSLGNYFSFYRDSIPIINTEILSPFSRDAFSRYTFTIDGTTTLDERKVYIIGIHPTNSFLPAFEGKVKILDETYDIIEVEVTPAATTAIAFVHDLKLHQKFEQIDKDLWYPTYWEAKGKADIAVVRGLAAVEADVTASSVYTDLTLNRTLSEDVFSSQEVTVAPGADQMLPEFWQNNSLSALSPRERMTYQMIDSAVAIPNTGRTILRALRPLPYIDFNRVGGLSLGASFAPSVGPIEARLMGAYSLALEKPLGEIALDAYLLRGRVGFMRLEGSIFSRLSTASTDRSYPRLANSAMFLLNHDYYDYYQHDGFSAGGTIGIYGVELGGTIEMSNHFPALVEPTLLKAPLGDGFTRHQPIIIGGRYRRAIGELRIGNIDKPFEPDMQPRFHIDARLTAMYGDSPVDTNGRIASFRSAETVIRLTTPTIATGYNPMLLRIQMQLGIGRPELPVQYQFRFPNVLGIAPSFAAFYTAPMAYFGGTDIVAGYIEHNFSDLFWRWLGLPTYEGRGLELIISGASGLARNEGEYGYHRTVRRIYMEGGVGIGKIPIFISNVLFLRLDARWGISSNAKGNSGAALTLSSPF
jgi:hypothetical protein